jgi:transcriptional regulator with GAF, ATPase, and Fis domain
MGELERDGQVLSACHRDLGTLLAVSAAIVAHRDLGSCSMNWRTGDLQVAAATADEPPVTAVTLADAEREHILGVLRDTRWVVGGPNGAAARLGMKRTTLQWKMKQLGIARPA